MLTKLKLSLAVANDNFSFVMFHDIRLLQLLTLKSDIVNQAKVTNFKLI